MGGGNPLNCDLDKSPTYKTPRYFYESIRQTLYYAVIARFCIAKSWQSTLYCHSERSKESLLATLESKAPYGLLAILKAIPPIRSYIIYFSHRFKSRDLDTSLRNATLIMTNYPHSVILRALARSIHFGDSRIALNSLTLSESMSLKFARFATFHTTFKGIKMQT